MRYLALHAMLVLFALIQLPTHCSANFNDAAVTVPFQLRGNSIMVEATINGIGGNFIIDTGAPVLVLNEAYFEGTSMQVPDLGSAIVDVNGKQQVIKQYSVKSFTLGGLKLAGKYASVTDLSKIERIKGGPILGIIGYPILKNYEVHFDFIVQELTLVPLKKKGIPVSQVALETPDEVFELKFSSHIPYLISYASGKKVRLGIDSGSEVNVMHEGFFKRSELRMEDARKIRIQGLSGSEIIAQRGAVSGLCLEQYVDGPVDMTLTNLTSVNQSLPVHLHGFLGVAYLKNMRFSINYKKKEMCIWTNQDTHLIDDLHAIELQAGVEGNEK